MIKDMIAAFKEHIEKLEWMDEETKSNAIEKVESYPMLV